ncbi:MAG: hypothetical protein LBB15_02660, partial [Puniceicoccales bacterium]|nr:hypothetical protein [Puniceicoccales bacterium]
MNLSENAIHTQVHLPVEGNNTNVPEKKVKGHSVSMPKHRRCPKANDSSNAPEKAVKARNPLVSSFATNYAKACTGVGT